MLKTSQKIFLARIALSSIMLGRRLFGLSSKVEATRNGIRWNLDLEEGIDFSIYLLGGFELQTMKRYRRLVKPGDIVLDVGANVGAHTLPLASLIGDTGRVIAFEPTDFAYRKLISNITLNPNLSSRIMPRQVMLVGDAGDALQSAIYSSWPLITSQEVHEKHRGCLMPTTGATTIALDQAISDLGIERVDFIKLDVDGHEYDVLIGGERTIDKYKPMIVMELEPCLYDDRPDDFDNMVELLIKKGYAFYDVNTGKSLPLQASGLRRLIPDGASRNIIASCHPY